MSSTQGTGGVTRSKGLGVAGAVFGILALAGFTWMWVVTATPIDPPDWLRIGGIWLLPVGIVGALAAGIPGLRGAGRTLAIVGLVAAGLAIIGFVLLISLWPV